MGKEEYGVFGAGTRGRLLRATASVVARAGVRGCTVQDVLDEAGVSRRTFYKQFQSMEDALDGLFEVTTAVLPSTIEMAVAGETDPAQQLIRAVDAFLNLQQLGGRLIIELHAEAIRPDSLLAPRREAIIEAVIARFEEAMQLTHGRAVDPLVFRGLVYAVEGMIIHMQRDGTFAQADQARVRAAIVPMILRTLRLETSGEELRLPGAP